MKGEFEIRLAFERLPLSRASVAALRHVDRYDAVVFTSKHARSFFMEELKRRRFAPPQRSRIVQVGPRNDLLKFDFKGKRILFPRSGAAPFDIIRKLRKSVASVRVVSLYIPKVPPLSLAQKRQLQSGKTKQLYFKSPSGISGLLRQYRGSFRTAVLSIPARCIGETTASAARKAGFRKVFIR